MPPKYKEHIIYLPIKPKDPEKEATWDVIRTLSDKIGQELTDILSSIEKENPNLQGIIDRVDFNATTHGQRDIEDDRIPRFSLRQGYAMTSKSRYDGCCSCEFQVEQRVLARLIQNNIF